MSSSIDSLKSLTKTFFKLHWGSSKDLIPNWSEPWNFDGELPNHDKQGCYALFSEGEIVYIGIGIGKGTEKYENNGIGYRTKRYWCLNKDQNRNSKYSPTAKWQELDCIRTIGFGPEDAYLAAALEIYLIQRLEPPKNSLHKRT